jgi:hypothetical protein
VDVHLEGVGVVEQAQGFWSRWRGLRGSPPGSSLLLRTRSVHGFGMDRPLLAVGLDSEWRVVGSTILRPNRVAVFRGARWVLELPADTPPPVPGTMLVSDE